MGLLSGVIAPGTASATDGKRPIVLFPDVWEAYQEYSNLMRPGAFAVSNDGSVYGYSYCPEIRCVFNTSKKVALKSCEESGGTDCVIFAYERDIKLPYRVLDLNAVGDCPTEPVPRVTIVADIPPPDYDYSYDVRSLTAFEKRGRASTGREDFELLGLAVHDFESWIEEDLQPYIHEGDGLVCAGFHDSEIRLHMSAMIYVANDFPKDSCLHREVLAHEEQHHEVARRLFTELASDATRRLADELRDRPFLQVADPGEGRAASHARVKQAVEAAYVEFARRYEAEQAAIDTKQEYHRIANACPAAQRYVD